MASAFTLTDLSLHYSEKHLLEHVSLTVSEGEKIGIVGRNGAGKSTLLRLLAGVEEPDRGEVARKRGLTVAYLPQTPALAPEATITQAALDYLPAATPQEREAAAYEAQTILSRLGFTDFQQKVSALSGGQKMRVALAGVLPPKPCCWTSPPTTSTWKQPPGWRNSCSATAARFSASPMTGICSSGCSGASFT